MTDDQKDYLAVLAYVFLQNNKFESAIPLLRLLREVSPADPRVALSLAYGLLSIGDPAAALRELDTMPVDIQIPKVVQPKAVPPNPKLALPPGNRPPIYESLSSISSAGFAATWIRAKAFYKLGHPESAAAVLHDFYLQHGDPQLAEHLAQLASKSSVHPYFTSLT